MQKAHLIAATIQWLAACGVTANLPVGQPVRIDKDEAVLVLGVRPDYKLHIVYGYRVSDTVWEIDVPDIPQANLGPSGGYIVIRLAPTHSGVEYGVSLAQDLRVDGPLLFACKGSNTIAFALPAGQATYVGELLFSETDAGVLARLTVDPQRAQRYLAQAYPTLPKLRVLAAREKRVSNALLGSGHFECLLTD
jgi:hypothetical protein